MKMRCMAYSLSPSPFFVSPSPQPSPRGEREFGAGFDLFSLSPRGEGWGEGAALENNIGDLN